MKLSLRSRTTLEPPGVVGAARVDRRFGAVLARASSGDVVVLDRVDLDRSEAEALLERGVLAVVDASSSISGRYPNLGPQLLVEAGVVLLDQVGSGVFGVIREGTRLRVHDGFVFAGDRIVASGRQLGLDDVERLMADARAGLGNQLQALTHNTSDLLRREEQLLLHGVGLPRLDAEVAGRPVVVVVRGFDHEADLRRIRSFLREREPLLVGVDAGADALLAARLRPDVVVLGGGGGPEEWPGQGVSDAALTAAKEVVLHTTGRDGSSGEDRLDRLGLCAQQVVTGATTEDVALLLADSNGASVIVTVGTHATLEEFLDRRREGLPSTFLTRLRVGSKLIDAKGVSRLYRQRIGARSLLLLVLAALVAIVAALGASDVGRSYATVFADLWDGLVYWVQGLYS